MAIPLGLLMLASLSFGIWYATFYGKPNRKKALAVKSAASLLFVLAGLVCWLRVRTSYGLAVFIALFIGAAADIILGARFVVARQKQKLFLAGMGTFALGHAAYIAALNRLCRVDAPFYVVGIALGIAVCAAPMVMKKVHYGKLRAPVFGYSIVLGIVLACAIGCAVEAVPGWQAVLAAALLFSFSDFVLMLMTFSKGSLFGNVINLITYYAAQLLFAGSVLLCR